MHHNQRLLRADRLAREPLERKKGMPYIAKAHRDQILPRRTFSTPDFGSLARPEYHGAPGPPSIDCATRHLNDFATTRGLPHTPGRDKRCFGALLAASRAAGAAAQTCKTSATASYPWTDSVGHSIRLHCVQEQPVSGDNAISRPRNDLASAITRCSAAHGLHELDPQREAAGTATPFGWHAARSPRTPQQQARQRRTCRAPSQRLRTHASVAECQTARAGACAPPRVRVRPRPRLDTSRGPRACRDSAAELAGAAEPTRPPASARPTRAWSTPRPTSAEQSAGAGHRLTTPRGGARARPRPTCQSHAFRPSLAPQNQFHRRIALTDAPHEHAARPKRFWPAQRRKRASAPKRGACGRERGEPARAAAVVGHGGSRRRAQATRSTRGTHDEHEPLRASVAVRSGQTLHESSLRGHGLQGATRMHSVDTRPRCILAR
eukprot:772019-Pleurochrysis_carterae.AAC.2